METVPRDASRMGLTAAGFHRARFTGGTAGFNRAEFTGGTVDFRGDSPPRGTRRVRRRRA